MIEILKKIFCNKKGIQKQGFKNCQKYVENKYSSKETPYDSAFIKMITVYFEAKSMDLCSKQWMC